MVWFWKYGRRRRAAWTKDRASFFYDLIPGFRILKCSAHKIHRMLCAFYFLNKRCADGIVGGRDIYQQGLAGVWFVKDRG